MTAFTRLGAGLWTWDPWVTLRNADAQLLWLALYTTAEARRHAPGLWQGGVAAMAEASNLMPDAVVSGLERLIAAELVEYDAKLRVLRLSALPDAGEYPDNGKVILSWWTRFKSVPECGIRDAHVATLRWILDEGARRAGKAVTDHHEQAWRDTFGSIRIPVPRKRGARTLLNSDTSTHVQPSLFGVQPSGNGSAEAGYSHGPQGDVDISDAVHQPNKNKTPETVTDTVSVTDRIPDPGSRISDLSGEGERGRGGGRPPLALVPPFTAAEVLAELAKGLWDPAFDRTRQDALSATIPAWVAERVTLADFAFLAEYSRISQERRNLRWLLGCDIVAEVSKARRAVEWRDVKAAAVAQSVP